MIAAGAVFGVVVYFAALLLAGHFGIGRLFAGIIVVCVLLGLAG